MEGMLGGSITIECPLPETYVRIYLCRTIDESGRCTTVVSSSKFVREEFKHRVTLEQYPDRNLFLVEMTALTKNDSGVYACGVGLNTDRGKTQQITLTVHSGRCPTRWRLRTPRNRCPLGRRGQAWGRSGPHTLTLLPYQLVQWKLGSMAL